MYHYFFRCHVCSSNLKRGPSRELPLTARKTVFSHLNLKYLWKATSLGRGVGYVRVWIRVRVRVGLRVGFGVGIRAKVQVKVFGAFFIRYGAYTYNCMRYPSLTLSQQLFTENNLVVSQRIRSENQDEKILNTASY